MMRITYDPDADVLYIELRSGTPDDSVDIEDGVTADLDAAGHLLGIELLDARERLGRDALASVALEQLPLAQASVDS
jgi:uncharacterized protein YuzE